MLDRPITPIALDTKSIVLTAEIVDLDRFCRKLATGRWRGQRKRQKAEKRYRRAQRAQWQHVSFTFGTLNLVNPSGAQQESTGSTVFDPRLKDEYVDRFTPWVLSKTT